VGDKMISKQAIYLGPYPLLPVFVGRLAFSEEPSLHE
jgi:hypothetical protein